MLSAFTRTRKKARTHNDIAWQHFRCPSGFRAIPGNPSEDHEFLRASALDASKK
jgi:hypothetical protein